MTLDVCPFIHRLLDGLYGKKVLQSTLFITTFFFKYSQKTLHSSPMSQLRECPLWVHCLIYSLFVPLSYLCGVPPQLLILRSVSTNKDARIIHPTTTSTSILLFLSILQLPLCVVTTQIRLQLGWCGWTKLIVTELKILWLAIPSTRYGHCDASLCGYSKQYWCYCTINVLGWRHSLEPVPTASCLA